MLAYKMSARQMGFFTLVEWERGLMDIQCDTIQKLQMKLDYLRNQLMDPNVFKCVYRYAYDFARVSFSLITGIFTKQNWKDHEYFPGFSDFLLIYPNSLLVLQDKDQRSMDIETAKAMLQLLLSKIWLMYPDFGEFLQQSKYKVINKDQWCNILEFSRTITSDLRNYDVDGACKYSKFPL